MHALDFEVLQRAAEWLDGGHRVHLCTVVQTWGSAPRLPGALLALRDDGHLAGSVSGGCIEDDLADQAKRGSLPQQPALLEYGVSRDEAQRFGIPCGGLLRICVEPLQDSGQLRPLLDGMQSRRLMRRSLQLQTGEVQLAEALPGSQPRLDGDWFHSYFGPHWRLLIIGANQLGAVLASMAQALDFAVLICDPREEMRAEWRVAGATWLDGMPDDVVRQIVPDAHSAIVAVTHDPKLDDMALLEALKSPAFYVGAIGSKKNNDARRKRLAEFDLAQEEIARLHGPVGLKIGSKTPPEIAIAILAEMTAIRNDVRLPELAEPGKATAPGCVS